jgi:hypothetical protein
VIGPIWAGVVDVGPPQSSSENGPPISTTRTCSGYCSPNIAMAPIAFALSSSVMKVLTGNVGLHGLVGDLLDPIALFLGQRALRVEVEPQVSRAGSSEPA